MKSCFKLIILKLSQYTFLSLLTLCLSMPTLLAEKGFAQNKSVKEITVQLKKSHVTVEKVFKTITSQTDFTFNYSKELIDIYQRVSLSIGEFSVEEALLQLSKEASLSFRQVNNTISVKPIQSEKDKPLEIKVREDIKVSGKVSDENGQGLPGVSVVVKESTTGTITDSEGIYSINADESAILVFSYIGYETRELAIAGRSIVDISMTPDVAQLEEIVVIGYGSVNKSDLTGSVNSIQGDKLNTVSQVSLDQAIQGRIPGVQVTQASAEPGGAFSIRIRGTNSITAGNEPLFVVDGLPGVNPGNALNMSDIQSIEVLKDASATAIYGARGSNGVILISTKQGKKGSPLQISYDASVGVQNVAKKLDLLNTQEYIQFYNEVHVDRGNEAPFSQQDIAAAGSGTDWQDEILRTALMTEHRLSFSGGSNDTQYYLSLDYFNQEGIVLSTGHKKYVGRINLIHSFGQNFKVGINLQNSVNFRNSVPLGTGVNIESGVIATALQLPPTLPVFDDQGNFSISLQDLSNSVAQAKTVIDDTETRRLFGNVFVEYQILKNLSTKVNLGYNQSSSLGDFFFNTVTQRGILNEGQATKSLNEENDYLFEFTTQYDNTFNESQFKIIGGYSFQRFQRSGFNASAQNFPTTSFSSNNLGAGDPTQFGASSSRSENTLVSGFGRANYNFGDKYLLTATFRADGSSRFGESSKVAYFPSGAVAWRISNEPFFSGDDLLGGISELKLRASYGISGNQEIGNARSLVLLSSGPIAVFDGIEVQSIAPTQLANPDLKWETTRSFDVGIDFEILNGRIAGSLDYFQNKTKDLLLALPIPTTTGFQSSLQNVGDTKNSGLEINISSRNLTGDFSWSTDFNFATLKNEVTNLGELPRILQGGLRFLGDITILDIGNPINSYFGYQFDGVFQSQQDIDSSPVQANAIPGGRKFRDINEDGEVNDEDRTILGDPFPDFTLGLNNTLDYKNFKLDLFLEGRFGFELANFTNIDSENPIDDLRNRQAYVLDRWTPNNPTNEHPSFVNPSRTFDFNSRAVEDASFLRLKSIRLSYTVPNSNVGKISSIVVYLTGQNLFTITGYDGFNPDISSLGSSNIRADYSAYPLSRIYSLGVKLKI